MMHLNLTKNITLNVNHLNTPTEIVRLDKRTGPNTMLPPKIHFKYKDTNELKVKG